VRKRPPRGKHNATFLPQWRIADPQSSLLHPVQYVATVDGNYSIAEMSIAKSNMAELAAKLKRGVTRTRDADGFVGTVRYVGPVARYVRMCKPSD